MAFSEILGQDVAIQTLKKTIRHQRLPSAYLFTGSHNIGKQKTMLALTQVLNCEQHQDDACLRCNPCLQIANQSFPDFSLVVPEGQFIKIAQIKEALKWIQLRPATGNYRILGVIGAEKMNKESANAFLKTLEEPPPQTLIMLLAEQPQQLLETIVSRCRIVRFQRLKKIHIQQILQNYQDLTPQQITFLSQFSLGRIRVDWIEKIEWLQSMRELVIDFLLTLSSQKMDTIFKAIENWGSAKEGEWSAMLDFLEYWFRDLEWLLQDLPQKDLFNQDRIEQLQECLKYMQPSQVSKAYHQVLETRKRILMNAHVALSMQALWIDFKNNLKVVAT